MIPRFAREAPFDRGPPLMAWDEWDIAPYYADCDPAQLQRLVRLTPNANHALVCACGYWIAERFARLDPGGEAEAFLDVASASSYDAPLYEYFEIDEEDWRGPVRGPQALMITIAVDALFCLADDPEPAVRVCYMFNLCRHVLDPDDAFLRWFEGAVARMEAAHLRRKPAAPAPLAPPDYGEPVPMTAFDLDRPYLPQDAAAEFARAVARIDPENPFLARF
ncbi:hypothetical protein LAZ40_12340 [Cereibacter sphaeroides]|uniref:hypothetical protein n=1 Tax=Cereibacter sphaeroides TaxID=1063 RepID=UPI001F17C5A2|nr:hypothetical protein [Cereibacter sphaeroides]MCE6959811.1 hypothetical protein [Cereibacter sphaeroides]MCE6968721.1 hypothetical protein [Cereibacter sphaeroides]MCE6974665.1 hypothetical protein [Cereibacter sphaeroides]